MINPHKYGKYFKMSRDAKKIKPYLNNPVLCAFFFCALRLSRSAFKLLINVAASTFSSFWSGRIWIAERGKASYFNGNFKSPLLCVAIVARVLMSQCVS